MDRVCMLERLQWIAWQPGAYKTPLLIPLFHKEIPLFKLPSPKDPTSSVSSGDVWRLYPTMVFVDMDIA